MSLNDAREYHTAQTHYLRAAITYADNGTTVSLGWVPDGAVIINAGVNVYTAFNGDTTNTLNIGYRNGGWTIDGFYNVSLYENRRVDNAILSGRYENIAHYLGFSVGKRL